MRARDWHDDALEVESTDWIEDMSDDNDEPYDDYELERLLESALAGDAEAQFLYGRELLDVAESPLEFDSAYAWLRSAARRRHGEAWWQLAVSAETGSGCERPNPELAVRLAKIGWFRTATAHCCTLAGDALETLKRFEESALWYRMGADAGDDDAMCSLGVNYRYGRGVGRDLSEMIRWYVRAARRGSASAMWNLSICRRNGEGARRDERSALRWNRRAAAAGHPIAAVRVAAAAIDGDGTERVPELGRSELERLAVENGNADAAHELGARLLGGNGLVQDPEDGVRWLGWARDMGCAQAATDLAVALFNGRLVERDVDRAVELYRWAADNGDATALRNLGLCHRDGDAVECDPALAQRHFEEAAEMGDAGAAVLAATHHLADRADARPQRAVELLEGVIEEEDPVALRLLAQCLESGRGGTLDPTEAARLRALADERTPPLPDGA